jgi:adenosine/AMP kinase
MIEIEGNNGGDYLKISHAGDNLVNIEVGHSCVVTVRACMPVEILTSLISRWKEQDLPWAEDFNQKILSQVREYNFWGEEV